MTEVKDKNVIYGLWCLCHPEDGIRYVGQTTAGIWARLGMHLTMVRHNVKYDKSLSHVQRWIIKHGAENISISILDIAPDPSELDAMEEFWIKQFDNLTNIRTGGTQARGWKMPDGFSEARSGENNPMWGVDRKEIMKYARSFQTLATQETRRKMSESKSGTKHTEAARRKISDGIKASWTAERREAQSESRAGENHPLYGKEMSEKTRHQMSMSRTKLTEDDIRAIRRMRSEGMKHKDIVGQFPEGHLSESASVRICKRERFDWIED